MYARPPFSTKSSMGMLREQETKTVPALRWEERCQRRSTNYSGARFTDNTNWRNVGDFKSFSATDV